MCSNLYRLLFINLIVTTNQKCVIDTHMKERKECKHNTKESRQITKEESKEIKINYKNYSEKQLTQCQ